MTRAQWETYISEQYNALWDHPFESSPESTVFRHPGSRKWFALFMEIPLEKLGSGKKGSGSILNLKCDPLLQGSLVLEAGFYPAYHMSKTQWITVVLEECEDDEKVKWLIDISFQLTFPKQKRSRREPNL